MVEEAMVKRTDRWRQSSSTNQAVEIRERVMADGQRHPRQEET